MTRTNTPNLRAVPPTRPNSPSKVPPHDLDAEAALIGAMLLSRDAIDSAGLVLTAVDFYRPAHAHIFDVIVALAAQAEAVDPVTVADELRRRGLLEDCGGPGELVALQANTPAISGASRYATIVAGHSTRRRLIAAGGELAELGYANTEIEETVDRAEQMVLDVTTGRVDETRSVPVADLLAERMSYYEQLAVAGEPSGLKFGWVDMDNYMPPMKPGQLVVVGGRPSMGKSAFALNMASHVAYEQGAPVLFVSLEMTKEELTDRLLSAYGRVEGRRISTGKLQERDWGRLADAMSVVGSNRNLVIDDTPALTMFQIAGKARRARSQAHGLGLIVIDYAELVGGPEAESENLRVGRIAKGAKTLARQLNCTVVLLSQIKREVEARADKRPGLADFRASGDIEAAADIAMTLYRDDVYDPQSKDRGVAEVHVVKYRNAATGTYKLAFLGEHTRFADMART